MDGETGTVLGGEGFGRGGRDAKAAGTVTIAPLSVTLPKFVALYARRADPSAKSGWASIKSAAFTIKDAPTEIAALKTAVPAKIAGPSTPPDQLILVGKDNTMSVYGYDPATGILGDGTDWVTVPSGFRDWMQKRLISHVASHP